MNCMRSICPTRLILAITLIVSSLLGAQTAQADSAIELQKQVHRMQTWMGMGPNAQNWRKFLSLSTLETQVVLGNSADVKKLELVQRRFHSGASGLDHPIFAAVSRSLDAHIARLKAAQSTNLESAFANASFKDIGKAELARARATALQELNLLEAYYRTELGPDAAATLKATELAKLKSLIGNDVDIDLSQDQVRQNAMVYFRDLTTTARNLRIEYGVGLNDPYYALAKDAVDQYLFILRAAFQNAQFKSRFANDLAALKTEVSQLSSNRELAKSVGVRLEALESAGQIQVLATLIRQKYSRPNLYVSINELIVNQLGAQDVNDTSPVSELILGRLINGTANTHGKVFIDFVNDPEQAHISLQLRGKVVSDSYTREGPITAFSNSYADVEARRSVLANIGGLQAFDSYVAACLRSSFRGTDSLRIVTRIAERQFLKDRTKFDSVGAYKAEQKLKTQFDNQTNDALANGSRKLAEGKGKADKKLAEEQSNVQNNVKGEVGAAHANRFRLLEPRLFLRTTDSSLNVIGTAVDRDQLAAFSEPPKSQSGAGILIQIHESLISNVLSNPFKGDTYRNSEIPGLVKALAPKAEPVKMDENDNFSITFDPGRPIQIQFDSGSITLVLAASRFRNAGVTYRQPFFVKQKLNLVKEGGLKLIGEGTPVVEFQNSGRKNAGEVGFRRLLQDRIGEAIKESGKEQIEIELPPNLIPEELIKEMEDPTLARGLKLVEFESNDGWLTVGYQLDPNVKLPKPDGAAVPARMTVPVVQSNRMPNPLRATTASISDRTAADSIPVIRASSKR